jgi:hypothetical protein
MIVDDSTFSTQNTALAAYLFFKGIQLIEVISPGRGMPATLIFENTDGVIRSLETEFYQYSGDAAIARPFFSAYKDLLRKIKSQR